VAVLIVVIATLQALQLSLVELPLQQPLLDHLREGGTVEMRVSPRLLYLSRLRCTMMVVMLRFAA
jgi:hypothetical protein